MLHKLSVSIISANAMQIRCFLPPELIYRTHQIRIATTNRTDAYRYQRRRRRHCQDLFHPPVSTLLISGVLFCENPSGMDMFNQTCGLWTGDAKIMTHFLVNMNILHRIDTNDPRNSSYDLPGRAYIPRETRACSYAPTANDCIESWMQDGRE